jgi:hypothetical protein
MSDPNESMSTGNDGTRALLSSSFLEFCAKVRHSDPSILPKSGAPLVIRTDWSEKEHMELADALLENTNVTSLELDTHNYHNYIEGSGEAMVKYVRSSKHLQHIFLDAAPRLHLDDTRIISDQECEAMFCSFLPAFQESTSLKKLHISIPLIGAPSYLALENMLTHTQSLQSLTLLCPKEDIAAAVFGSGLQKNTTLREFTMKFPKRTTVSETNVSTILSSLCDHRLLRKLCLHGHTVVDDLTGLETLLLSDASTITELDIQQINGASTHILRAAARRPTLTKLGLHIVRLGRDDARLLRTVLRNTSSLQTLAITYSKLGSAELAEIAPALGRNTSIKELDISGNNLDDIQSAEILKDILRINKTLTALDLSRNGRFQRGTGAVKCIADGLGSNSTLQKIDLSGCISGDGDISKLAKTLGSRNTALQNLSLRDNDITSAGVLVLTEMMEQNRHITDLNLSLNQFGNEGASLLARSLINNALPNLTRLSLYCCGIGDDGFIALVSALEQNTSLLQLDLCYHEELSERSFLALARSLPEIKVLQEVHLSWSTVLASATPFLLTGLRKNTSLFRFRVGDSSYPITTEEAARCVGGWMQETERLGYRNRFLSLMRASKLGLAPRGIWPHALAQVATLTDVIFEVLRSNPSLVSSEETEG